MAETTVVQMDQRGRLVIPKPVREAIGAIDSSANVRVSVEVVENDE